MKNANALLFTVVGVLLASELVGFTVLYKNIEQQNLEILYLKTALDSEIKARKTEQVNNETIHNEKNTLKETSVSEVFANNSTQTSPEYEDKLNKLKQQYEEAIVLHMFLAKCAKSTTADFHTINSNLSQDMAAINAPGRLQYDIMTAAKGSFEVIYSKTSCEGEGAEKSEKEFRAYIEKLNLRSNLP